MPSSRATMAAGTRPPRVTHTIAWNGPAPASRQASARASRWHWSQEPGKAFCGCGWGWGCGSGCAMALLGGSKPAEVLAQIEHEIELRREAVPSLRHAHQQLAPKQAVAAVGRLVGEIELGGKDALL